MLLTQQQLDKIAIQVNAAGGTKYSFLAAVATNNDKKLGVVAVFNDNGDFHTASVSVGDDAMWLVDEGQFDDVVTKAVAALGRP